MPYEVSGKTSTTLSTEVSGARTDPQKLTVEPAAPGIFVVLNQDYSINSAANPAAPNSVIILYATGEGQTDPAGVDGKIATSVWPKPLLAVTLAIGGNPAKVLYAGAAPYLTAGAMQINARLPASSPVGTPLTVRLSVGGYSSQDGVSVMVRK